MPNAPMVTDAGLSEIETVATAALNGNGGATYAPEAILSLVAEIRRRRATDPASPGELGSWAHLEAMGHRGHWGHMQEVTLAGAPFLQVEVFRLGTDERQAVYLYPPSSIYCLTPCDEAEARLKSTPYPERPGTAIAELPWQGYDEEDHRGD
jgi:hypothetical protein